MIDLLYHVYIYIYIYFFSSYVIPFYEVFIVLALFSLLLLFLPRRDSGLGSLKLSLLRPPHRDTRLPFYRDIVSGQARLWHFLPSFDSRRTVIQL